MISNDLANLADRLAGHALHSAGATPAECSRIAAELLKLSHIVAKMEGLPFDRELVQSNDPVMILKAPDPTPESKWFRRSWQNNSYGDPDI